MSFLPRRTIVVFLMLLTAMQSLIPMTAFADIQMRCAGMAPGTLCAHRVQPINEGTPSGMTHVSCACCHAMGASCPMGHRQVRALRSVNVPQIAARSCALTVTVVSSERTARLTQPPHAPTPSERTVLFARRPPPLLVNSRRSFDVIAPDRKTHSLRAMWHGLRAPPALLS